MTAIETILDHAEQHCRASGSRLTTKRKQVLESLIRSNKALSAYELVEYCEKHYGHAIPAMSVYRILDFLRSENLVHRLELANKYVACSHIQCDHQHGTPQFLICRACNKVTETSFQPSTVEELKATVEKSGFNLVSPQLELNCLCKDCSAEST